MKHGKKALLIGAIVSQGIIIPMFIVAFIYLHDVMGVALFMFSEISEIENKTEFIASDITYNAELEPSSDRISERWAKEMIYNDKKYDVYAYEFVSEDFAKKFFIDKMGRKPVGGEHHGAYVNYANKDAPYMALYMNNVLMVYHNNNGIKNTTAFLQWLSTDFTVDLNKLDKEMRSNGKQ